VDRDETLQLEAEAAIRHLEANLTDNDPVDLGRELNAVVRQMGGPDAIVAQVASGDWRFRRAEAQRLYAALRRRGVPAHVPTAPEWPEKPRRIEGPADIPGVQHRVFGTPETPALPGEDLDVEGLRRLAGLTRRD
jgi:hypothetical protein